MGVTFQPVFNRKKTKNKSGLYSIHVRVTIDRKTEYINPDLPKISSQYWSGRQNKWVKESHPNSYEINSLLQRKLGELDDYILQTKLKRRSISFDTIKSHFFRQGDSTLFNDFIKEYLKNMKGLSLNTIKVYQTFEKHLNNYNSRIKFSELNEEVLFGFKNYLQHELNHNGGTTKKYFDKFKVICKEAVRRGYVDVNHNPFFFTDLKFKIEKPKRTYLEVDEIKALIDLKFTSPKLEMHRDHFLFMIFSGLYYKDLKNLKKSDLRRKSKKAYISGNRIKNDNSFLIPIYKFKMALELIEKYEDPSSHLVFPNTISDQKFNEHLKDFASQAEIKKVITNKVARHTNVQLWIGAGVERQFVSKMVGHSEEATTQHYYDMSIHNIDSKISNIDFKSAGL
ncbi:site-specific integrase [Reichenbachiella carrageenanivorans]|uniref:Site-specific integrase n=1 Tax=Reichenbachiella carrageenanivorans TaxID=2979869 RepID=A0ABY6D0U6_9BACT|nr:site-specific integrase [Reichenbachiella carrageenanivorans]UXX79776.1 site-specific integrase [Reichenbachiella carrageenanivorans]